MLARLGLPSPRLATKLYCAAGLFLVVVCLLALATTRFAKQADEAVTRFRQESLVNVALAARLQVLLEKQRRLVATAAASAGDSHDEGLNRDLSGTIADLIDHVAPDRADKLSARYALLMSQAAAVFDLARDGNAEQARAGAARYAEGADGLALEVSSEANSRSRAAEAGLDNLSAIARSLVTWVSAAVALIGLLFGPVGLLFLRRMRTRLQSIGTALIRLARNDTSVDIPGVAEQDEFGQLARSVSVFKAKSIELLNKKADFERLNLQLDAAINHMPLGLSMFDGNERLLVCNRRYADMYELPSELARPGTVHCALWEHRTTKGARHSQTRDAAVGGGNYSGSMLIEFAGGRTISVSRQPLRGGGWVSLHEDITERRRQEEKIARLARHDSLTGLANRVLFREQLEQSLQQLVRGQGFAVLSLDLDHFKAVNDTLGHPIGDSLLKEVSERLLACVRHGDLVARLGGDEFAIIQASVRDPDRTESLAARIVETVSAPYEIEGHRVEIATSIGITLAPRDGSDADRLMKNADLALYRAKGAGRRTYSFFMREMNEQIETRRTLETDLRRALQEEELELHYQPIFCLATERIAGAEVILRWQHRDRGRMSAAELAALAEEAGLIAEMSEWAMRQACAQAARWPAPIKVALNVSALQFARRSIMESVLQALAQSGLPPRRLELEVPESMLLPENRNALAMLHQLRQLGVRIALDEFGTGYCSLANLRAFPFDTIKIDKALIADIDRRDGSRAIVEAVIALGTSLGMATVAEGVEDVEQLGKLRAWRCSQAQGFMLSPALPAPEMELLLAQGLAPVQTMLPGISRESAGSGAPPESSRAA
jgi:diguanylate cyclase (GGDEF)-like protein